MVPRRPRLLEARTVLQQRRICLTKQLLRQTLPLQRRPGRLLVSRTFTTRRPQQRGRGSPPYRHHFRRRLHIITTRQTIRVSSFSVLATELTITKHTRGPTLNTTNTFMSRTNIIFRILQQTQFTIFFRMINTNTRRMLLVTSLTTSRAKVLRVASTGGRINTLLGQISVNVHSHRFRNRFQMFIMRTVRRFSSIRATGHCQHISPRRTAYFNTLTRSFFINNIRRFRRITSLRMVTLTNINRFCHTHITVRRLLTSLTFRHNSGAQRQ